MTYFQLMSRFSLALRLLWRDSRSGELTILLIALMIAVTSSSAISIFTNRLQSTMTSQAAEFLAADLVIKSPALISEEWINQAQKDNLMSAQTVEFTSVLIEHDELLLASIKGVSAHYPLRGVLKVSNTLDSSPSIIQTPPQQGTAWVEKRVLSALNLKLGDSLVVGKKALIITNILTYEPDKRGDFYSFSPRVMIHLDDLPATGVVQPGSRVSYYFQFAGDMKNIDTFHDWLKPQLNPSQRIMDIHSDRPELGGALERAQRYLGLCSIVIMLISGVAIAMATQRYTERHFNATAILRCLGCSQQAILWLYGSQFLVFGLLASVVGCLLGLLAQEGLFYLLKSLLPQQVVSPSLFAILFGFVIGFVMLIGFALPPLLRLKHVSPLRVLRRELSPMPSSAWLVYGLAIGLISLLIWQYTQDLKMTATILGGGLLVGAVLGLCIYGGLQWGRRGLPQLNLTWRFGLQHLLQNSRASVGQIMAFSLTFVAMILSFTVRTSLLDSWQQQLPKNAPNHFALNIFPPEKDHFQADLQSQSILASAFYPVVSGRLVEINQTPVQKIVSKDSQGENAINRELSLTWAHVLPVDNKLVEGEAWQENQTGLVSVEQKLAKSLQIHLGDTLTFTVGSEQFMAQVANIRSVEWETMKPNFYMIFSAHTIEKFPSTFLTSFYLPENQKEVLNSLLKTYPSTTILEVDAILQQFKTILNQLTQAINYLLYFALIAGLTVLFAAVYATLDYRIYEGALMRSLGASRRFLRKTHLIEFCFLGLMSGVLAVVMSETILYFLYTRVMHIHYQPNFLLWFVVPLLGLLLVGLTGFWGVRKVVNQPPMKILREQ